MGNDRSLLAYHVVDVFASQRFAGNPLAVVLDADELTGDQMQQLASEFHLSETAFPLTPSREQTADGADYALRIFTPEVEIPFAGHPSIGTAWLLRQLGRLTADEVRQSCGEGLLPITVSTDAATLTGGEPRVGEPIDPTPVTAAVGLSAQDVVGEVRIASTGLGYAVLPVKPQALDRCRPDMTLLKSYFSYPGEATGVYVVAWDGDVRQVQARMFAGDVGVPEDPATGSAALALGAYLAASGEFGDGTQHVNITQGVSMGRPSSLHIEVAVEQGKATRVRVTGAVVRVAEGRIHAP
ncbi:MAG TPA: PhzF family phenazine biosynthesis protein [Actinomycetes bacterium]|nr:PhzF family phenazine biosynthesis protein [Actinomycetes bacterium]